MCYRSPVRLYLHKEGQNELATDSKRRKRKKGRERKKFNFNLVARGRWGRVYTQLV